MRVASVLCAALVSAASFTSVGWAQVGYGFAPETAFPISLVAPDNASATVVNPSALAALDSWSLTYSHIEPAAGTAYRDRYDGVWLASPLFDGFTLGTGMEFARARGRDANGFMLGGAMHASGLMSFGATWHLRSPKDGSDNIHSADLAISVRPSPTLGFTLIGRDLAPHDRRLGTRDPWTIRESGTLAMAVRPTGDDRLTLELAGRCDAQGELGIRTAAQVMVPYVGRVGFAGELGEFSGRDVWTLTAGLDVRFGQLSVAPAAHFDQQADEVGWSLLADVHGTPRIGVPTPGYVAKIELRGLGPRGLISTMRTLDRALHDPNVRGVLLIPNGISAGLASAQELRLMIEALERAGKPVYCYLEAASGAEYYACAAAQRRTIDPAGMVRLMGVGGSSLYFGELLRKVGVRADFVRIGRYKSAPEQYTNDAPSEDTRMVRKALLDGAYARLVHDLAGDLGRDEASVRALIDRGPFLAEEAEREGLVATTSDRKLIERDARTLFGGRRVTEPRPPARDLRFGPTPQIGVVVIDGTIVDGKNVDVPILDIHMSGGRTVSEAIDRLADDKRIRVIVLRIDSPGGAVMASDQIWRAVKRAREKKPVIASMGEVAASGGYYVAAAANEIWASPSTITGSIGIFYGKVDVAPLAEKIGVGIESDTRGAHAGADSVFRPFSDEERAALAEKLRIWYRQFLERVAEGRKMPIERVDELGRGRVYSGDEARAAGLVDALGGFASALARARELAQLGPEASLEIVPQLPSSLLDLVLGGSVQSGREPLVGDALRPLLQQLYVWTRVSGFEPMALYEGPLRIE